MHRQPDLPMIYVVDDDEAIRSSLSMLAEARGWEARTFSSAIEFLAEPVSGESRSACLVLDLNMPEMNGAELLAVLRASGRHLATVILTAWPDSQLARRALESGANRILGKPLEPSTWLNAVEDSLSLTR